MENKFKVEFPQVQEKNKIVLRNREETISLDAEFPIEITVLGGRKKKFRYDSVEEKKGVYCGTCLAEIEECTLEISDSYEMKENWLKIQRTVACTKCDTGIGIHLTTEWNGIDSEAKNFDDYQFIVPGSFYNKNDTDGDGKEDYLGTFCQDYKDDRNPSLFVMEYCRKSKMFLTLIRADVPQTDTTITREQIRKRHFIHQTDIGSLGFDSSSRRVNEFLFRMDYPFFERNSFCLNVDGSEWAAYKKIEQGTKFTVSYLFYLDQAQNLTEAGWKATEFQMNRILNPDVKLSFSLEEARQQRREMTFHSYREFPDRKGKPAGFFVHFSPRKKYSEKNILEYGFSGQQTMIAYAMLGEAEEVQEKEYRERAIKTLDFFVDHCIEKSGLPNAMYDVDKEKFIYWWTGILYPFQYSDDRKTLEGYLGDQVAGSLMAVAEELKKTEGNYCRTMIDGMYYLFKSYLLEKAAGIKHENWYEAVICFCEKMLEIQNENGSWNRAYTMDGEPLIRPAAWFGTNELERGSGAIFPAGLLVLVYEETGNIRYLRAAERAAKFVKESYVENILYIGGLNDTTHIKSVKIDAVGVMFAMRTMLSVYEHTKDPELLLGARDAARVLATWTYLWDIPFDSDTTLGKYGFKTTGWTGCDVIPACSYVDDEFVEFVPDLLKIAHYCKDRQLAVLAKIVTRGMQHGLSMPQNMYGYAMPGVQCEGYMTSLWLADTEYTEFSGASAKNKGDDNDTCNGLVNAQAILNLAYIKNTYHTYDFDEIIEKVVK